MNKAKGNTIIEYSIISILVIVVSISGLTFVGTRLNSQFQGIKKPATSGVKSPLAAHMDSLNAAGLSGTGLTQQANGISISSNIAYSDIATKVQTAGANGTTTLLANSIEQIGKEQLASGQIDEKQYNQLIALANQGYRLAAIQAAIETAVANTRKTGFLFKNVMVTVDGKTQPIIDWCRSIGFSAAYEKGLLPDPLTNPDHPGKELQQFLELYNQAQSSGALSVPTIDSAVTTMSTQIATISDSVFFAAVDILRSDITNTAFSSNMADRLLKLDASTQTDQNSGKICTVGNGKSNSNSNGNGQNCTGG